MTTFNKVGSNFFQIIFLHSKNCERQLLKFCQNGEISTTLVTLAGCVVVLGVQSYFWSHWVCCCRCSCSKVFLVTLDVLLLLEAISGHTSSQCCCRCCLKLFLVTLAVSLFKTISVHTGWQCCCRCCCSKLFLPALDYCFESIRDGDGGNATKPKQLPSSNNLSKYLQLCNFVSAQTIICFNFWPTATLVLLVVVVQCCN